MERRGRQESQRVLRLPAKQRGHAFFMKVEKSKSAMEDTEGEDRSDKKHACTHPYNRLSTCPVPRSPVVDCAMISWRLWWRDGAVLSVDDSDEGGGGCSEHCRQLKRCLHGRSSMMGLVVTLCYVPCIKRVCAWWSCLCFCVARPVRKRREREGVT